MFLTGMFALIGFVIWDRRSAISPVIRKTEYSEAKDDRILKALREYSHKNSELLTVLKNFGLLLKIKYFLLKHSFIRLYNPTIPVGSTPVHLVRTSFMV